MKRVVMIAVIIAVITSLFAFPTYATTYNPSTYNSYTDAVTYNGVTYNVRVTQLKALSEGTSMLPGGMETIMLVSLQMTNNTNVVKAATIPKLSIDLSDERVITDVYTYGGDFTLGLISGGIGIFYPGTEFSLDNNKVVVPPNKSLYCVGAIGLPAQLNQTGDGTLDTGLRGVHLYDKSNYSVTDGNYSYGNPVDLSSVIQYIDGIETSLNQLNLSNSQIVSNLTNIINGITYSGQNGITLPNTYSNTSYSSASSDDKVRVLLRRYISPVIVNSIDTFRDSNTDTIHYNVNYNVEVVYDMRVFNRQAYSVISHSRLADAAIYIPDNKTNITDVEVVSSLYREDFILNDGSIGLYPRYLDNYLTIIPSGYTNTYVRITYTFNYSSDNPVTPTWGSLSSSSMYPVWGNYTFDQTELEYDYDSNTLSKIFHKLTELYKSLTKPSSEDNTEEAQDMNDEIHEQEQVWYDNNSDALEEVGLSNYRFSQSQSSGITQAVTQFQAVWNALGQWTNVYIFILILSISTYIIRHEPTTRVKQYRSSVQAERAERISYYGKKNAESRAASSGSTFKAALRRRK